MLAEPLEYFKGNVGFARLLNSMFDTYIRHGRVFGAVRITLPTKEEELALSEFFSRDYFNQALIRVSLAEFEHQLHKNFTPETELPALLEAFCERPLSSYEDNPRSVKSKDAFSAGLTAALSSKHENTPAESWIRAMTSHMRRTYRRWVEKYLENPQDVIDSVGAVAEALNNLPQDADTTELRRLTDFSARFTGSPYSLSSGGAHSELFLRALAHHFGTSIPNSAEDSIKLYLQAGLLCDGVLSQVSVRGLKAAAKDGAKHSACALYNNLCEPHILTLENISHISSVEIYGNKAFIIENPLVYAAVCERLQGIKCTIISPMGSGNHSAAFWQLLKLCRNEGAELIYAGNMDYKGLINADKLYMEFGKSFKPWRYTKANYDRILEKSPTLLPDEKKDLALHNEELASLLSLMKKVGKTASSMPLAPYLAEDIRAILERNN